MKKLIIGLMFFILYSGTFARLNIRVNTFGGIGFIPTEEDFFFLVEFPLIVNYEFSVPGLENDTFAIGASGSLLLFPFSLVSFSYIHCMQPQSAKNYRWNIETEIHSGFSFLGEFNLNNETSIFSEDMNYCPTFIADVLFTYKPKTTGFYFGAGPVCSFMYVPYQSDPVTKWGWTILPSLELSVGYTF